jgi:TolB protein
MTVSAPPRPPRPSDPVTHGEFEALVEALIEEARRRAQRRRRRNGAIVTLVALVGVMPFAVIGRSAQSQTASPALSARSSLSAAAASSKIAFISEPPTGGYCGSVHVMNADGSGRQRLTPGEADACAQEFDPAWSPDGRKIAIVGNLDGGIYVMNADGSGLERLTSAAWQSGLAWSPDGRRLAFTSGDRFAELYVINADGTERRRLARDARHGELAWSPRGDKIAFVNERDGDLEIYVINADGTGKRRLTRNTVRDSNPVWSPNGRKIAYESNWQLWVMNADGSGQRRLTRNGGRNFAPAWSPDGQRIAFERRLGRRQSVDWCSGCGTALIFEVHVMNADGSGQRRLTRSGAKPGWSRSGSQPQWSPDGRKIAFVSKRDGNFEIYVMNADGSGQRNLTRTPRHNESGPAWSAAQR